MMTPALTSPLAEIVISERTVLHLPSRLEWIAPVVENLRQKAELWGLCNPENAPHLAVVLEEALTNAIVHGNQQKVERIVEVVSDYTGDRCTWSITDQGAGFDFETVTAQENQTGHGLVLLRAFADELRFEEGGRRVLLTLARQTKITSLPPENLPFLNPVELFFIELNKKIDYDNSTLSVCHELTPHGLCLLMRTPPALRHLLVRLTVCDQLFYLPAVVQSVLEVDPGLLSVRCTFPRPFDPQGAQPSLSGIYRESRLVRIVTAQPPREPGKPTQKTLERREHVRVLYQEQMRLVRYKTDMTIFALNLSRGGIAFLSPDELKPGENYTLMMPQPEGPDLPMPLRLIHCRHLHDKIHEAAGQFLLGPGE